MNSSADLGLSRFNPISFFAEDRKPDNFTNWWEGTFLAAEPLGEVTSYLIAS